MRKKHLTKYLALASLVLLATAASAQNAGQAGGGLNEASYVLWGLLSLVVFLFFFLGIAIGRLQGTPQSQKAMSLKQWWSMIDRKLFTKAVAVEKEQDILLDHDYDGIKELDNSLPPWWKYGFYLTIVIAVFYMLRFHVWNTGPTPEQEYETEMKVAAAEIEAYRKQTGDMVDEKTVTMADAPGIADGKKIYQAACFACHGSNGEGGVGPNLTDAYWIHGGSINDVFKTIKYGVPDKGMQAWEKAYSPTQLKNLASYIKSLQGSNPANGKAPQGELYAETTTPAVDSTGKE